MPVCQCQGLEDLFNDQSVRRELRQYRRSGPAETTRLLTDELISQGVQGATLLDIGGGLGAIQHALLAAGAERAEDVDASRSYLMASREEAARRGLAERIRFIHGDLAALAGQVEPADIVTLDRVICCYDDMHSLVNASAGLSRRLLGLVYPRDTWWVRLAMRLLNFWMALQGSQYRAYLHPSREVEALVLAKGFKKQYYARRWYWQVAVYAR